MKTRKEEDYIFYVPELFATSVAVAMTGGQIRGDSFLFILGSIFFCFFAIIAFYRRWNDERRSRLLPRVILYILSVAALALAFPSGWMKLFLLVLFVFYARERYIRLWKES